jgi:hypothetical protein
MKLTTKQIMQILPMDEKLRLELRATFDTASQVKQFYLATLLWEQYNRYLDLRVKENIQLALSDENTELKGSDYYERIREKTEHQLVTEASNSFAEKRLSSVRDAMEEILKAAKKAD